MYSHVEHVYRNVCHVTRVVQTSCIMKSLGSSRQANNISLWWGRSFLHLLNMGAVRYFFLLSHVDSFDIKTDQLKEKDVPKCGAEQWVYGNWMYTCTSSIGSDAFSHVVVYLVRKVIWGYVYTKWNNNFEILKRSRISHDHLFCQWTFNVLMEKWFFNFFYF